MKSRRMVVVALAALAGAMDARTHEVDPGSRIEVACARDTVSMIAITRAVESNHRWASQTARRQMLSLARQACASGAAVVTFAPPADERPCRTPPTWSTLCRDRAAAARALDISNPAGRRRTNEPDVTPTVENAP